MRAKKLLLFLPFLLGFSLWRLSSPKEGKIYVVKEKTLKVFFAQKHHYCQLSWDGKQWILSPPQRGELKAVLARKKRLYYFFKRHFCIYEKGKLLKLLDYPPGFSFVEALPTDPPKIIGKKGNKLYLLEQGKLTPLPLPLLPKLQIVLYQKEWFLFGVEKEEVVLYRWKKGEKLRHIPTTLSGKTPFLAFLRQGKLYLLGEFQEKTSQVRLLLWDETKESFLPLPNLTLPITTSPIQDIAFFEEGEKAWLLVLTPLLLEIYRWEQNPPFLSPHTPLLLFMLYTSSWIELILTVFFLLFLIASLLRLKEFFTTRRKALPPPHLVYPTPPLLRRGLAYFTDWLLIGFFALYQLPNREVQTFPEVAALAIYFYGIGFVYFCTFEYFFGKTLGKAAFGMRVIQRGDHPHQISSPRWYQIVLRNGLRIVDDQGQWLVALFTLWITPYRRIGDLLGGTFVLDERASLTSQEQEIEQEKEQ